jgi:hypothetical protein
MRVSVKPKWRAAVDELSPHGTVPSWQQDDCPAQKVPVGQQVVVWQPVGNERLTLQNEQNRRTNGEFWFAAWRRIRERTDENVTRIRAPLRYERWLSDADAGPD